MGTDTTRGRGGAGAVLCGLLMMAAASARADRDPDWPCAQPLVASLTTGTYWNASIAPNAADWRADPAIAGIVAQVAPRDVPPDEARARLSAFADSVPAGARPAVLGEVFGGLLDETNVERRRLIARIKELARRQRDLSRIATQLAADLRDAPPGTPAFDDLTQRRDFTTRAFQEAQRTMRYACEAPVDLDGRLGLFARTLQGKLGN